MAEVKHENSVAFPSGFAKKGEKHSYYCDLCLVELSSDETMIAHKRGQKHVKKQNLTKKQCIEEGKIMASDTCYIFPISAAKPAPKKIPIRLKVKMSETSKVWILQQVIYSECTSGQLPNSSHPLWVGAVANPPKADDWKWAADKRCIHDK